MSFRYKVYYECELTREECLYLLDLAKSNCETESMVSEGGELRVLATMIDTDNSTFLDIDQRLIDVLLNKVVAFHNVPKGNYTDEFKQTVLNRLLEINTAIDNELLRIISK